MTSEGPKNGCYVHKDGSLRRYKDNMLHCEDGPAIEYDHTTQRSYFFAKVEYFLDGIQIINWDDPNPKVQELKKYKETRDLFIF